MLPNAPPMITPTARSTTFPLKAKALNSSTRVRAFFAVSMRRTLRIGMSIFTRGS